MRAMLHQLFHLFTSQWIPDIWQSGIFTCESRVCVICGRSQFRSTNGLNGRRTAWLDSSATHEGRKRATNA